MNELEQAVKFLEAKLAAHAQMINELIPANLHLKSLLTLAEQALKGNSAPSVATPAPVAPAPSETVAPSAETTA